MGLVLDASVALAWILREQETEVATRARAAAATAHFHAPAHWPLEMVNALLMAARKGTLQERELGRSLQAVTRLPVSVDVASASAACGAVALLAKRHGLTAYDAAYLELALRLEIPLATQDRALLRAAAESGAAVF